MDDESMKRQLAQIIRVQGEHERKMKCIILDVERSFDRINGRVDECMNEMDNRALIIVFVFVTLIFFFRGWL